ncbi:hypothetical protein DJ010_19960 [Nocardioides silvaticus]|uniref:Calcium-binding protein n=1 Tax=Nocardioides silvaticus TaxID=2201891 RepID=A0A316TBL6_9ACTN|nr:calcium-binding protein [Nocardioides silvaticus]PWN01128.1 hypothetical protein DJ010_19960 [Nocardioides silvaticus]
MRRTSTSLVALVLAATFTVAGTEPGPAGAQPASGAATVSPDRTSTAERQVPRRVSLTKTRAGYYYSAWGSHNRVTVTLVEGGLKFRDPRPTGWDRLARACTRQRVDRGVSAICPVPAGVSPANPLLLKLEMRLGNDYVNTSALGPEFKAEVLADAGREVIRLGAGDDWVNGYLGTERVWAGGGNDFVRGGEGDDVLHGEDGNDELVGLEGSDVLYGGQGRDQLKCGDGSDAGESDPADAVRAGCERVPPA